MLDRLPRERTTIAERLKEAGYATAFLGKWHLAGRAQWSQGARGDLRFYPEHQGFDVNVGGCAAGGPPSFFSPFRIHNLPDRREGEYLPDRLADETLAFARQHREEPFAANRFLAEAARKNSRRLRFQQWLLLAVRMSYAEPPLADDNNRQPTTLKSGG